MFSSVRTFDSAEFLSLTDKGARWAMAAMYQPSKSLDIILRKNSSDESESPEEPELVDNRAFYGTAAVAFLSVLAWYGVGFFSIPILIGGTMLVNHKKNLLQIISISVVATLIFYGVFFKIFSAPLPLGLLE